MSEAKGGCEEFPANRGLPGLFRIMWRYQSDWQWAPGQWPYAECLLIIRRRIKPDVQAEIYDAAGDRVDVIRADEVDGIGACGLCQGAGKLCNKEAEWEPCYRCGGTGER